MSSSAPSIGVQEDDMSIKQDLSEVSPEKRCYTVAQFVAAYGISRTRLYAEVGSGRLIARRIGGRTMIARHDADAWLAALPCYQPRLLVKGGNV